MLEKESNFIPRQDDLNNEDVVTQILESGTPEELEQVGEFHKLTSEQIKLFSQYAKLRKQTREQIEEQVKERKKENPTPTEEELEMGCYIESIEPQVRAAVLNLRRKGYATYESGFHNFKGQKIGFEEKHLENFQLPKNLIHELELKGKQAVFSNFLTDLKEEFGGSIILIPIAKNLDISSLDLLIKKYNINETSIILDEKIIVQNPSNFYEIENRIRNSEQQ